MTKQDAARLASLREQHRGRDEASDTGFLLRLLDAATDAIEEARRKERAKCLEDYGREIWS